MLRASEEHHSCESRTSVGVQTDDDMLAATRAATPAPSPVNEYMTPGRDVTRTAPAPVIEHVPGDTYAAPAPLVQQVALTAAVTFSSPAPVTKHVSFAPDDTFIAPASPRVNRDICGLVNTQFSICAVEAPLVDSFPSVDESDRCRARKS